MPEIAAVVGNYRGERLLPDCLASLARQSRPLSETIVVDAGSSDRSAEVARELGARVLVAENRGLGHLYNVGARAASAELVFLANNDIELDERCLELLAEPLERDERLFAADPVQVEWETGHRFHGRSSIRRGPLLRQLLPGYRLELDGPAETVVPTLTANAGGMLVRRRMLLELGGFDETFFLDYEDLDLCWRAWLRGWGSVHVPAARFRHRVGATNDARVLARRYRSSHHNMLRFALKCLPVRALPRFLGAELLRLPRHPRVIVPALVDVARELPEILRLRRELRPSAELFEWLLAGQEGPLPARRAR